MKKNVIRLDKLSLNTHAKVNELNCTGNIRRRMLDLGLIEGTDIVPILKSPLGDPVAYQIRGSIIALRQEDSKLINVRMKNKLRLMSLSFKEKSSMYKRTPPVFL